MLSSPGCPAQEERAAAADAARREQEEKEQEEAACTARRKKRLQTPAGALAPWHPGTGLLACAAAALVLRDAACEGPDAFLLLGAAADAPPSERVVTQAERRGAALRAQAAAQLEAKQQTGEVAAGSLYAGAQPSSTPCEVHAALHRAKIGLVFRLPLAWNCWDKPCKAWCCWWCVPFTDAACASCRRLRQGG